MKLGSGTFCTIFPGYRDYHFYKDPGQLPYRVSKLGYDTYIVCCGKENDYPETRKYLRIKAISGHGLSRKFNASIVRFLLFNSRKIDILNLFHISWPSLLFIFIYKAVNKKGFAYLKLDNCVFSGTYPWEEDFTGIVMGSQSGKNLKRRIKGAFARRFFMNKVDLWSVEDEYSREQYEEKYEFFRGRIITVTNGHTSDLPGSVPLCGMEGKEEIILTAGRLGSYQKATEVLLEAFRLAAPGNNYKLHLAGPVDQTFRQSAEAFLEANPDLKERVIFHGLLGRDELYSLYCRSRIFCMPSRYEGMAIVFPEAMYYSNAIVTTWQVSLKWYIDNHEVGITVEKDDPEALATALGRLMADDGLRERMAENAHMTASGIMNWNRIAGELIREIERRSVNERN
jgi:glycosyltransferase involved in cell wall biosynthesis